MSADVSPPLSSGRGPLLRWFISSSAFGVPQAAGPIAFSLVALSLTGEATDGAAMMLAMTLAQVAGAIPIARLGGSLPIATVLRVLVVIRTLALVSIALLAASGASFTWLIVLAAVAGSVNGAAHGYLRAVLNHLAPASRLPRTLGIAATLNELTFVLAPVAASGLGTVSPVFAVLVLAVVGAVPLIFAVGPGSASRSASAVGVSPSGPACTSARISAGSSSRRNRLLTAARERIGPVNLVAADELARIRAQAAELRAKLAADSRPPHGVEV